MLSIMIVGYGKSLLGLREKAKRHIEMKIGNGMKTSVWFDKWCNLGPLSQIVTRRDLYDARFDANATISEMVSDNQWIWSNV